VLVFRFQLVTTFDGVVLGRLRGFWSGAVRGVKAGLVGKFAREVPRSVDGDAESRKDVSSLLSASASSLNYGVLGKGGFTSARERFS
jgi:hypothetical protein